VVLEVPGEPP